MGQTTYEEELAAKKELVESYIGKYCKNIHHDLFPGIFRMDMRHIVFSTLLSVHSDDDAIKYA